ncbi:MAG: lanthionine synthetase C family protein [Pyrinomonadaceae bacterium]
MALNVEHNSWRPLLSGESRERARAVVVREIVAALPGPEQAGLTDFSLAGGDAGLAVLCAYLGRAGDDGDENAAQFLGRAVEAVSTEPMSPSLYGGFTGVAWATAHLQEQLLDPNDEDPCDAIDDALRDYLNQSPWADNYDLVGGLVGFGVYALERLPRPVAVECLRLVIARLAETAERKAGGITWLTSPELLPPHQRAECPDGYYNLGVAHGVPGVIALLGQVWAAGIERERVRTLLDGAVAWLMTQKLPEGAASTFLCWSAPGVASEPSRLAWCYGDLGIANALLAAARCVGVQAWEREALEIARRAAERPAKESRVVDARLCHGAAGAAHLFNRMFLATHDPMFEQAARFWFERTLELRRPRQGIAGFTAFMPEQDGKDGWVDESGLLTGAAGIALALLAAATDIEPEWDQMLLISIPRP